MTANQRSFNTRLSGLRIVIEHTIGILKARFASLRSLPHRQIWTVKRMNWCLGWIGSCVVLHNMLLDHDNWEPVPEELELILREMRQEEEQGLDHNEGYANQLDLEDEDTPNHDARRRLFQKYLKSDWAPANRRN